MGVLITLQVAPHPSKECREGHPSGTREDRVPVAEKLGKELRGKPGGPQYLTK